MQIAPVEVRKTLDGGRDFVPPRPTVCDWWLGILDRIVRIITLGRGHVSRFPSRGPIRWNGVIK